MEDVPGMGKTMLAKTLAKSIDCDFGRVQFTPDLLPSDITGIHIYNQKSEDFVLKKGPVNLQYHSCIRVKFNTGIATKNTVHALLEVDMEGNIRLLIDGDYIIS